DRGFSFGLRTCCAVGASFHGAVATRTEPGASRTVQRGRLFADGRGEVWLRVHVKEEPGVSRRPLALSVEAESHYVTVLGLLKSSIKRERGFRIRLGSGEERTLVREPLGQWYLEQENWT